MRQVSAEADKAAEAVDLLHNVRLKTALYIEQFYFIDLVFQGLYFIIMTKKLSQKQMPKTKLIEDIETINPSRTSLIPFLPWILVALVLIGAGIFAFQQHREAKQLKSQIQELKQNPQKVTEEETKALLDKVGALIELPAEQPTVATVT